MTVSIVWSTPNAEELIAHMARVSAPENQNKPAEGLIKYLIEHQHWSPLEMVNVVLEINTTRDIARQILRHRSFSFQEFSQRYAEVSKLGTDIVQTEARLQDHKNRQNSIETDDKRIQDWWEWVTHNQQYQTNRLYNEALDRGIAKEVARKLLPEGLTRSRMYMNGTLRSWVHYILLRTANGTQKEHIEVAQKCEELLRPLFPNVWKALGRY